MLITYIARRSLISGHVAGNAYTLSIGTTAVQKSRKARKSAQRALSGATETFYFGADDEWSVTFEPVRGAQRDALVEFLNSTESGDTFSADVRGLAPLPPVNVRRADDGYQESDFMPVGSFTTDWLQMSMTIIAT